MESKDDLIIVKAKIRLRTISEGGRSTPVKSGFRPNHVFDVSKDNQPLQTYVGDIQFHDFEAILPGESKIVTIRFLRISKIEPFMKVGQKWLIYEVPHIIAEAEILEI